MLPDFSLTVDECVAQFSRTMDTLISRYATRLLKLRVDEIEVGTFRRMMIDNTSRYDVLHLC